MRTNYTTWIKIYLGQTPYFIHVFTTAGDAPGALMISLIPDGTPLARSASAGGVAARSSSAGGVAARPSGACPACDGPGVPGFTSFFCDDPRCPNGPKV